MSLLNLVKKKNRSARLTTRGMADQLH